MTPKQENALMVQFEEAILNWLQSESENTTTLAYKLISVIKESIPSNYDNDNTTSNRHRNQNQSS